jgi:very-short-patch-repair endonuclease
LFADFFFPHGNLLVEINGSIHEGEYRVARDKMRYQLMKDLGFNIKTYTAKEVIANPDLIALEIKSLVFAQ